MYIYILNTCTFQFIERKEKTRQTYQKHWKLGSYFIFLQSPSCHLQDLKTLTSYRHLKQNINAHIIYTYIYIYPNLTSICRFFYKICNIHVYIYISFQFISTNLINQHPHQPPPKTSHHRAPLHRRTPTAPHRGLGALSAAQAPARRHGLQGVAGPRGAIERQARENVQLIWCFQLPTTIFSGEHVSFPGSKYTKEMN